MALSVTPTSGAGPYTFTVEIRDKSLIDGVRYDLEARGRVAVGECSNVPGTPIANARDSIMNQGFYVRTVSVDVGSCYKFEVVIIDLATSEVISSKSVNIDNV